MTEKDFKYTSYLIGAMQITAEGDTGETKREKIEEELLLRDVFPINPATMETIRTGMGSKELGEKMRGWIASGNWELFKKYGDLIWKGKDEIKEIDGKLNTVFLSGDCHYVEISDWITAIFNKGDSPCGTFFEAGYAYKLGKPIYLITDVPKKDLKMNFLVWVVGSGGEVFPNKTQYFNFIDEKYGLRRKE